MFEEYREPIPKGFYVCHVCDVRNCINPDHLFLGTHADNMRDMKNKGRAHLGEAHGMAKLTNSQVLEIRASKEPYKVLASKYNVVIHTIQRVRSRDNWKHI